MRIVSFSKYVHDNALQDHTLNNSTIVIDGTNFLYKAYQESTLPFVFGCESDRYAEYLRIKLNNFKNAKVKCYIIFKGGHEDIKKRLLKEKPQGRNFVLNHSNEEIIPPVFMTDVYKEVLDEMSIEYVISELESKRDCIALARKLSCPILSNDIEFFFSGVPYIPFRSMCFDKSNIIKCGLFTLDNFLRKFNLTEQKLAIFVVLTDQNIFPEGHFTNFFKSIRIFGKGYRIIMSLLPWLSRQEKEYIINNIFNFLTHEDRNKFVNEVEKMENQIHRVESGTVAVDYLLNKKDIEIGYNDKQWFAKGVALKHITIQYINLYRSNIIQGSQAIADNISDDALLLSLEIIKYAYDLLTNFQNKEFTVICDIKEVKVTDGELFVRKPIYEADCSVFENGWSRINSLNLFEHFLNETLQKFDLSCLSKLSEDVQLLFISLVYFSYKKNAQTKISVMNEICSILLSYIMLGVVFEKLNKKINVTPNSVVTESDCNAAHKIMTKYLNVTDNEIEDIFDRKTLHPLVEFQYCLLNLNNLNKLCGSPYKPTVYSRTYNGTFVYKILQSIKEYNGSGLDFIKMKLNPASSVLIQFNTIIDLYTEVMHVLK